MREWVSSYSVLANHYEQQGDVRDLNSSPNHQKDRHSMKVNKSASELYDER